MVYCFKLSNGLAFHTLPIMHVTLNILYIAGFVCALLLDTGVLVISPCYFTIYPPINQPNTGTMDDQMEFQAFAH